MDAIQEILDNTCALTAFWAMDADGAVVNTVRHYTTGAGAPVLANDFLAASVGAVRVDWAAA